MVVRPISMPDLAAEKRADASEFQSAASRIRMFQQPADFPAEARAQPLVRIEKKNEGAVRLLRGKAALGGESGPGMDEPAGAMAPGNGFRMVRAAGIRDDDFTARRDAGEAAIQIFFFVQRDDADADLVPGIHDFLYLIARRLSNRNNSRTKKNRFSPRHHEE
jgi:hypothetical protein